MKILILLSLIGLLISIYIYKIERKSRNKIKIFGIKSSIIQIFFYIFIFLFYINNYPKLLFYLSIIGLIISIYSFYLLIAKIKNSYIPYSIINILNLAIFILSLQLISS